MRVSPARRIAFDVLRRVETQGAFASDALHAHLQKKIKREDAALATELTMGVLRWRRLLDFLIEKQARRPAADLDLAPLLALRIGAYQLRFLTRVPASAAVNESVELVKASRKRSASSFVNAVLRGLVRRGGRVPIEKLLPRGISAADRLGILHSHPTWMVQRWLERWGETATVALLEANNRPGRAVCAVHEPAHLVAVTESFRAAGLAVEPAKWLTSALCVAGGNPFETEAYRRGWFTLQDEASQMVAYLLDVRPGQRTLDLCAAPGRKTARLIAAAGGTKCVIAADLHVSRLRVLREQLERVGMGELRLVALDGTRPLPFVREFDRILVDAPCSGTGTLDRNPEIRWRLQPDDLTALHAKQVALLSNALERLANGGQLVYSTCSLEPEENEQVVEEAMKGRSKQRPYKFASGAAALAPYLALGAEEFALFDAEGIFRTMPHTHGTNGFYAAVIEREK